MTGVYAIVNTINGKRYIGSAINIERRKKQHITSLSHGSHRNRHLQNAWRLHGRDAFDFVVVEECVSDRLVDIEQAHITAYDAETLYNCGRYAAIPALGVKRSTETRLRMSEAGKNSDAVQRKVARWHEAKRGKSHCPQGHSYEHHYKDKRGNRRCRTCQRIAAAKWHKKRSGHEGETYDFRRIYQLACARGHLFNSSNTRWQYSEARKAWHKFCRKCLAMHSSAYYHRMKGAAA